MIREIVERRCWCGYCKECIKYGTGKKYWLCYEDDCLVGTFISKEEAEKWQESKK